MTVAVLCVIGVVIALAQLVGSSQESSRSAARERFDNGAAVRAQLTASLLATSNASLRAAGAKLKPNAKALDAAAKASRLSYAALLSSDGKVIATSSKMPAAESQRLAERPGYVRQALSGRAWLSNVNAAKGGPAIIDWAVPFPTPSGRRVLVQGFPAAALAGFLTSYLSQGSTDRAIYVIDSERGLIAASKSAGLKPSARLPATLARSENLSSQTIDGRYVAASTIGGSGWQLVIAQPTAGLYARSGGTSARLLWGMVMLAGVIGFGSLIPLRRSHVRAAELGAAHAQVTALNETLEARVAERTELAEQRAHALARSNSELEQFASVAAHDLQEPLRKIRMYCERLERKRDAVPEDVQADFARMDSAAGRMQNLISDLLDLARVNSRGREIVEIDLNEVADEVVADLEPRIAEVGASIVLEPLPVVLGDRVQMCQVMQNLLSNALKFHRTDVPLRVRVAAETGEHGRCAITVEDNGIGFEDEYAERIFGTFQRLHGRAEYEGTGIGLSIARKIAWRHDGDITATGVPGQGATFKLTLPMARSATAAPRETRLIEPERHTQRSAA
jgi:signal transduction histidine kinase